VAAPPLRLPAARRRRQLLDVALARFAANGFSGTSMDDVAEAAGVTKPVLYQHFGSKRQLFLELLDDVGAQLVAAIGDATAGADGPRQQVEAGFGAYVRLVAEHPDAFSLLFGSGARRDPEFADAVRRVEDSLADAVAGLIDADLDAPHRQALGTAIVGMAEGVVRRRLSDGDGALADPDRLARQLAELAWGGLRSVRRL